MRIDERLTTWTWLVRDTFRQSLASGIGWLLLGISGISILACLSVSVSGPMDLTPTEENRDFLPRHDADARSPGKAERHGVPVINGSLSLAFGAVEVPLARDVRGAVHFIQLILAAGVADTLGLLLTLVWTAGFLPSFLHPRHASVLLVKPIPRSWLLWGKYVGVLAFVGAQATVFVLGTWLALALRSGVWDAAYLWSVPLLVLHFAIFYSFSLLLAVFTRSTVACVMGSLVFWAISWGINFGRQMMVAAAAVAPEGTFSGPLVWMAETAYWLMPKPVDLGAVVFEVLGAGSDFQSVAGAVSCPALSVLTSLAAAGFLVWASGRQFAQVDY